MCCGGILGRRRSEISFEVRCFNGVDQSYALILRRIYVESGPLHHSKKLN